MIFLFLLWHLGPSAYWGSTGGGILLPLLWSLVGAAYGAVAKWRSRKQNIELAWNVMMHGKARALWGAALTGFLFSGALNISMYYVAELVTASAGAPRVILVILVGYLIAGLHYFLRDLCRPVISQPAYVRSGSASIFSMVGGALTWFPATIFSLSYTRGRHLIESMVSWALFIATIGIGLFVGVL
jgi:hypothetical protein